MQITTSILVSYAYGLLAPGLAQKVKEALLADESLRWQYEGILRLMKDHPGEDPEELLEKMSGNVSSRIKLVAKTGQSQNAASSRSWLLMAAIFISVILIGAFFIYQNGQSASGLAEEMIQKSAVNPFESITRGTLQTNDTTEWKIAFAKTEFQTVIALLEKKKKENRSPEEQFFLALSYIKTSPLQPGKAEPLFSQLTKQENRFTSDAWLYLGLTQTLLSQKEEAIVSLQHVEQTAQVKELEERLRK